MITVPGLEIFGEPTTPLGKLPTTPETNNFCPVSLQDWLHACKRAGIPHVPATQVAELKRHDVMRFEQPGEPQNRNSAAIKQAMDACPDEHMLRFDCCAGSDTKIRLSEGQPGWHPDHQNIYIGDPRAMEIMLEFPRELIPIWSRPWINARIIDGYPVEYRVFVYDGQAMGVSNYYPQRPLTNHRKHIDAIGQYTQALIDVIDPPFLWNYSPFRKYFDSHFDTEGVHFTADYIVDADDNVTFLEGGPPHHLGAHPCCFQTGETQGLALTPKNETLETSP